MQQLVILWAIFVGPIYVVLLLALLAGRRFFPEAQVLYELAEPILMVLAAAFALALAGVLAQLV
ncbi:MAG: hypothetical protein M1132_10490 [Chloroflexi bacterium]|nr:hypothetical protein [Chloroflexota bacterium]MCL5950302.1 hypothetical protein [Chloroflexota bacterium]MCL5952127.1 hypothetical protein [Chloroflexota bacterium]